MTCKDCAHYEVCNDSADISICIHKIDKKVETACKHFKDKSKFIELPCKAGDTVFVIGKCASVSMYHDNDYFNGTGSTECPFESNCDFEDCNDNYVRIFETRVDSFIFEEDSIKIYFENIWHPYEASEFGKSIFLVREEAVKKLKEHE